jgi:hypothetical protein
VVLVVSVVQDELLFFKIKIIDDNSYLNTDHIKYFHFINLNFSSLFKSFVASLIICSKSMLSLSLYFSLWTGSCREDGGKNGHKSGMKL